MIVLYSTHCPKCKVLEKKLNQKNINFNVVDDVSLMIKKGFENVPILEIDGKNLDFKQAVDWITRQE